MTRVVHGHFPLRAAGQTLALAIISVALACAQQLSTQNLANMGQQISPLAPHGATFKAMNPGLTDTPDWLASQAVTTVVSPLHDTLLVLTSGFNRIYKPGSPVTPGLAAWYLPDSSEYVFIYDISTATPALKQVLPIQYSTYNGIVFDPTGLAFYVAGGPDDIVHIVTLNASTGTWSELGNPPLALGHNHQGLGLNVFTSPNNGAVAINSEVGVLPCAAGVAISNDGNTLVVVNYYNDSITVFNKQNGSYINWSPGTELDLRPGKSDPSMAGVPGGEYPFWAVVKGNGLSATAYVSSVRDREIDVVALGRVPAVVARIPVKGQPNKMTLNAAQSLLYVADDQADTVDVIDTATNAVVETIPVITPLLPGWLSAYKGANPNSVTLSPDEKQVYVTDGNLNCVSVIALGGTNSGDHVVGLIPTGWYPNSTSFNLDGSAVYAVNSKSPTSGNTGWCYGGYGPPDSPNCAPSNQYNPQLTKAGLQSFPRPSPDQLTTLTAQVIANNHFTSTESDSDSAVMAAVRSGIQHVIFILKENRTYDQILGDLKGLDGKPLGNGDPTLTEFGETTTPNLHNLARTFVTLDNFLDTAEVSYDGWLWSTAAQAPDVVQRQWPITYAYRGLGVDSEGANRSVNVAIASLADRQKANPFTPDDPDRLPGQTDVAAPDGPNNEINTGYLWDSALRAGLSVRNYGFFIDGTLYNTPTNYIPLARNPYATGTIQAYPTNVALAPYTDQYFRGFDNAYPDFYRYAEWEREFDSTYAVDGLPALSLVRFMHDHTGNWTAGATGFPQAAIDGVNTPELEVADNDYAVGLLIQKIAGSRYANNTLIFVVEDDAQDGGDHVDSHRSTAFVVGAYVKQGAVVSTSYNTVNFLRTIEEVLGLPPMNLNDAVARPMADIFDTTPSLWSFAAAPSGLLYNTQLVLPPLQTGAIVPKPTHNAKYWARVTKGMDFTDADRVDPAAFNRVLWKGMMGNKPYPAALSAKNLKKNRKENRERERERP
ncbi:MAG: phosphoesterase [Acidobacteriia bacterium]|nr:phosphoesterase [Terriglobia bacterium]